MSTSHLIAGYSRYASLAQFPGVISGPEELLPPTSVLYGDVGMVSHASYGFSVHAMPA